MSAIHNAVWEVRERLARLLATMAHRIDPDVSADIYRGQECENICIKMWHNPDLTGRDVRGLIAAALY